MHIAFVARKTLYSQPGGDTVQVEQSAAALRRQGHNVSIITSGTPLPDNIDVLHGFNLGRPADLLPYFTSFPGKKALSSIYVDYALADSVRFPLLYKVLGKHGLEHMKTLARAVNGSDRWPGLAYALRGQRRSVQALLKHTHTVLTSSDSEARRLEQDFGALPKTITLPLGVAEKFLSPPKEGPKEGVLMLGRLEWLKNQKTVIQWATKHQWPLTVVGDPNKNQPGYYRECKAAAGQNITFLPHTGGEELLALLNSHKLLVVPSHFESFSLVGWEAAARGMKVLFNNVADMKETLAPIGEGMNFSDEAACTLRIQQKLSEPVDIKKSQALLESRSWDQIVMQMLVAYV